MSQNDDSLLILLVGSNPLPNYLSACALRPRRIALVHTKETHKTKERLKTELRRELGENVSFEEPFVEDATCATTVQRRIAPLLSPEAQGYSPGEVLLNYTGGTKVMAAHARMAFLDSRVKLENFSYLDEGGEQQPRLRFDNGYSKALSEYKGLSLDLKTILTLHGITYEPREPRPPAPTVQDACEILCKVLQDVPLAAALYCERERLQDYSNPKKAVSEPFRAGRYGLTISQQAFPTEEQLNGLANGEARKSWFERWYKFIGGEWLEEWIAEQIRALSELRIDPNKDIEVGFDAFRGSKEKQLEIDVAVIRGHRSYFISCTTDTTKSICKSKLFEIAVRSRQLGGDLARAALLCLADDRVLQQLRNEVDDDGDGQHIRVSGVADVKVFGLSDVRSWSDCDGKQPNRNSLKTWLES